MTETMPDIMKDIHDIRGPVMAGLDPALLETAAWACAGIILAALLVLLLRRYLKNRSAVPPAELVASIPAFDRACSQLDRLVRGPFHDPKRLYYDLGHTLKAYIGETLKVHCLEMTTLELSKALKPMALPGSLKQEILEFQEVCDPFRYAPVTPSSEQMQKDLNRARALVKRVEEYSHPTGEPGEGTAVPVAPSRLPVPGGETP